MAFLQINAGESATVQVAVRIRPLNKREQSNESIITVKGSIIHNTSPFISSSSHAISSPVVATELQIKNPESKEKNTFSYDFIYGPDSTQNQVFDQIGMSIIDNTFKGYNTCVFAYGQTGTGKSHSMMGSTDQPGLIPNICDALFNLQEAHNTALSPINVNYKVEISYSEIYAESVRDLLSNTPKVALKIREHPVIGPYVENLTQVLVQDFNSIKKLIFQGNKERMTAATAMNSQSSRSHAILTVYFTQIISDPSIGKPRQVLSKINLVDLAGSERVESSEVEGINFTEAININKSLTTLGNVISKLAIQSKSKLVKKPKKTKTSITTSKKITKSILKKPAHIPYRDSTLTWILKESLGGNSKTYMIATLSPSSLNYNESMSTLRYASNVKQIINTVKVNEDPNDKLIRALKSEIDDLKMQLAIRGSDSNYSNEDLKVLRDEIYSREELMRERDRTWEQKLADSKNLEIQIREQHKHDLEQQQLMYNKQLESAANEKLELERKIAELSIQTPRNADDTTPALRTITNDILSKQEESQFQLLTKQEEQNTNLLTKQEAQNAELLKQNAELQLQILRSQEAQNAELKRVIMEVHLNNNNAIIKEYETKLIDQIKITKEALTEAATAKSAQENSIKEIEELKTYNTKLKTELSTARTEIQQHLKRFEDERITYSKQIQNLKNKNHILELQHNCEVLDEKYAQTTNKLHEVEQRYKAVNTELETKSHQLSDIKSEYQSLAIRLTEDKREYDKLHNFISTIKFEFDEQIEIAKTVLSQPTNEDLLKINEGFLNILNKLKNNN